MAKEKSGQSFQDIRELFQEIARRFEETDRQFKETDRKFKETDRKLDKALEEALKAVSDLGGKWGRFVEGLIAPGVERMFKSWGIEVNTVYQRTKRRRNGQHMEIDILALGSDAAILIEAKSTLSVDDVNEHLERLKNFRTFFPEYAQRKVYGSVAGIAIEEEADRYAYRQGLFVIAQSGEAVRILNDKKFKPMEW